MLKILFVKKPFLFIAISVILLIVSGLAVYFLKQKQAGIIPSAEEKKQETLAEKQLKELEELRNKASVQPLTEEQMLAQQKELEVLAKKAGIKPLTQSQIQKQIDELENLRQGR
jgi:ABC-type lipoprotein release transport system permease subunit